MNLDPIVATNLVLCVIILAMGLWEYIRTKSRVELYIGTAFGLFGISHLITLLGLASNLSTFLIVIRICAYLIVIYALYVAIAAKKRSKQ